MNKRISVEQLRALTSKAMESNSALPAPKSPTDIALEKGVSVIRLKVNEVHFYDRNPRTDVNPLYVEIRESIRTRGLDHLLHVTKKPKDGYYTLARGGKTRLMALQELANEDPNTWEFHDFLEVPYVSEADLLIGHLVENLQRSDMSFWDTAKGIVSMREALTQDAGGKPLSQRDFAQALEKCGLKIDHQLISDYLFTVAHFEGLGSLKQKIGRNEIRNTLRPSHTILQKLWTLHDKHSEQEFVTQYHVWVADYALRNEKHYDAQSLQEHLQSLAAQALGYAEPAFDNMLHALRARPSSTLAELLAPPPAITTPLPPLAANDQRGHASSQPGVGQEDSNTSGGSSTTGFAAATLASTGLNQLAQSLGSPASESYQQGLKVAHGLVPNNRKGSNPTVGATHSDIDTDRIWAPPAGSQVALEGMRADQLAYQQLEEVLKQFAEIAGIRNLLRATSLRYGFYIELPDTGALGDSIDDLAIQGWWFLANLSGQLATEDGVLDATDPQGQLLLPPGDGASEQPNFRDALSDEDLWQTVLVESLGSVQMTGFDLIHHVLTHPAHPLGLAAFALLDACHRYVAAAHASALAEVSSASHANATA